MHTYVHAGRASEHACLRACKGKADHSTVGGAEPFVDIDCVGIEKQKEELVAYDAAVTLVEVSAELRKVLANAAFLQLRQSKGLPMQSTKASSTHVESHSGIL